MTQSAEIAAPWPECTCGPSAPYNSHEWDCPQNPANLAGADRDAWQRRASELFDLGVRYKRERNEARQVLAEVRSLLDDPNTPDAAIGRALRAILTRPIPPGECANPECDHDRTVPSPGCARRPTPPGGPQ